MGFARLAVHPNHIRKLVAFEMNAGQALLGITPRLFVRRKMIGVRNTVEEEERERNWAKPAKSIHR